VLVLAAGCSTDSGTDAGTDSGAYSEVAQYLRTSIRPLDVLIVSFDALRADHLGVYGYPRRTSPNIDAFARQALVFEDAWSAAPATPTSFAAAFTGKLPPRVFRRWQLVEGQTLAAAFAEAGYSTAFISNNIQLVPERGFDAGFEHYEMVVREPAPGSDGIGIGEDQQVLSAALDWISSLDGRPMFAWVHFLSPHSPYRARPGSEHLFDTAYEGRFAETTGGRFTVSSAAELARVRDLYDAGIFYGDRLFRQLLDGVAAQRGLERTLIVLTADHGEELQDHGALQHEQLYREVVRVPLIVRHPERTTLLRTDLPASNVDLAPTLAELAGLSWRATEDGVSWLGAVDRARVRVSIRMTGGPHAIAVQRGPLKALLECAGPASLFDLDADPAELLDLATSAPSRHAEVMAAAAGALGGEPCDVVSAAATGDPTGGIDDSATIDRLRALGYLEEAAVAEGEAPRLWAEPDPIVVCSVLGLGRTAIWFRGPPGAPLAIRVNAPDGPVMAEVANGGRVETGLWVTHQMRFYLVHRQSGEVVAETQVRLTSEGCG
jgi:arylsulfatase